MKPAGRLRPKLGTPSVSHSSGPEDAARPSAVRPILAAPVRTCVGCRSRDGRSNLLRVVVVQVGNAMVLQPDPQRRMSGRGAWVHDDPACYDQAERRKAFGRALRIAGSVEAASLRAFVHRTRGEQDADATQPGASAEHTESGFDADEHPMSTQQ